MYSLQSIIVPTDAHIISKICYNPLTKLGGGEHVKTQHLLYPIY